MNKQLKWKQKKENKGKNESEMDVNMFYLTNIQIMQTKLIYRVGGVEW